MVVTIRLYGRCSADGKTVIVTYWCVEQEQAGEHIVRSGVRYSVVRTMRVELIGHLKSCMTEIYLHIVARMADYIRTHP